MNKFFNSELSIKTSPARLTLFIILFSFIPMFLIWLLVGEFNLINQYWLLPSGANLWHGTFVEQDISNLVNKFGRYSIDLESNLKQWLNGDTPLAPIVIKTTQVIFDPTILAYLFSALVFSLIYPYIFKLLKFSNIDLYPFSITTSLCMFLLIITGMIPIWANNIVPLWWLIRIAIVAIGSILFFMIINNIINLVIIRSPNAEKYAQTLINQNKVVEQAKKELKESLKVWNDPKNNIEYVDIELKEEEKKK